jgi:hypothetical protein
MYDEPNSSEPCFQCKYKDYDSFQDETFCNHSPLAEGIPYRAIIDKWGSCEYYELSQFYR